MKKKINLFVLLCFGFGFLQAQTNNKELFEAANRSYEEGNYQEAQNNYFQLIENGIVSDDLHYNLANSLFKSNQLAEAILHYEKALKINPANADAAYNLELANKKTVDKVEPIPELFFYRWWKSIYNLFSTDTWAKFTVGLTFITLFGFILFMFSSALALKKLSFYSALVALILAGITWFMAAKQYQSISAESHAIITTPTVNIISAPSEGSSQLFVLHEGTKVKIKDRTKGWLKISLPNGNEGWIVADQLSII